MDNLRSIKTFTKEEEVAEYWKEHVKVGMELVEKRANLRERIAEIAVSACDIQWGGGGHWSDFVGKYTLKQFAEEIGMNYKTLNNLKWSKQHEVLQTIESI